VGDPAGRKIARYEIEAELAQGGMGVVYLARQPALDRRVVLKALQRQHAEDPREEQRFEREASAVAAVHHPNVVGVYDCFRFRGRLFIAQEYVDGVDAATVLARTGPLAPHIAGLVGLEIARGLEEIHGRGLVHRDLKPGNVLLGRAGEVKIADFGVALDARGPALTRTGTSLGTPAYMSPEQIQAARLDFRSDVFAFGVLLHELCSGAVPFGEPGAATTPLLQRIEAGRRPPLRRLAPGVPRGVSRIVHRCLQARPDRRARTPGDLRRGLERCLGAPSPADARREIADWLAAHQAFPTRARRTVRASATAPARPRARRVGLAAAGVALLITAALGLGRLGVDQIAALQAGLDRIPAPTARAPSGSGSQAPRGSGSPFSRIEEDPS